MNKSVYSIVLSDDVVAEIDRLAYREGTSRSNMINQILAQYVSYTTPEKRLSDIFSKAVELVESMDQLQVMLQLEGLFYTIGTLLIAVGGGSSAGYPVFLWAKDHGMFNIRNYHYPLEATFIMIALLVVVLIADTIYLIFR